MHALSRLADVWPGRVEPIGSKLQSLSKFAEPEVDGFLDVLNTPDVQQGRRTRSGWSGFGRTNFYPEIKACLTTPTNKSIM